MLKKVTANLDQKLWMTIGLGLFFSSFFIAMVILTKSTVSQELVNSLIKSAIEKKWPLMVYGLLFVAYVSSLIYAVRMLIIATYHLFRR